MNTSIDLFSAGEGGYAHYRIPGLVVSPGGTILAYCEARQSSVIDDWGSIDLLFRRSTDNGQTWHPREILASGGGETMNNPVAIPDRARNCIHFLYCKNYEQIFYVRSNDEGVTWSPPTEITSVAEQFRKQHNWNVIATGPGHGIQLANGRLIVPVWFGVGERYPNHPRARHHTNAWVSVIFSDDHGQTWQCGEVAARNSPEHKSPNETIAAQLSDGRVMLNIRTASPVHRRLITTSADGVSNWTAPAFQSDLFDPHCMASLLAAHSSAQNLLLFSNPDSETLATIQDGKPKYPRRQLTLKISPDDGKTWTASNVIEEGQAGYSDLAQTSDCDILCFYERGVRSTPVGNQIAALSLARWRLFPNSF